MNKTIGHYYLYAKNWYKRIDLIEDLRKIKSFEYLQESLEIDKVIITDQLLKEIYKYIKNEEAFLIFMNDLYPDSFWRFMKEKPKDFYELVIRKCLSILAITSTKDIPFELPEPDPSILPLRKDKKYTSEIKETKLKKE